MTERFSRTAALIGSKSIDILSKKSVAVIGLGGVGGAALEALCRAGIGRLILVDNDTVSVSNINRQLIANDKTVGMSKCNAWAERLYNINPKCEVIQLEMFYSEETSQRLFSLSPDYIIDAIDTVTSKLHLISTAKSLNIPIVTSLGTGNRLDPEKFKLGDIYETSGCGCGLARVMRRELRKRNITNLRVVYSSEAPKVVVVEESSGRHVPGSISFCPPVAGYLLAKEAVINLIK